ncbi:MAG: endonuclease/exonuclease/phosphatase family protein [Bacteroidetes bacterium]|nr:endonuclease/exonuclease/phosphatase family protein [Bacteroidota bacterium]
MYKNVKVVALIGGVLWAQYAPAQQKVADAVFWNVENFFDPFPNTPHKDPAFTPQGVNHWSWSRFMAKRDGIAKTLIAMGRDELPVWVGLCEAGSRFVLTQLVGQTPLEPFDYRIVHREGPDERGVNVALLYRPDRFRLLLFSFLGITLPDNRPTREILYAKGVLDGLDTVHLFVNHWPSKWGGAKASLSRRMAAATRLRVSVDSIFALHPNANIMIMGDFNDTPSSKPIAFLCVESGLHNLSAPLARGGKGTIRYRGRWELIDQFMVSDNLLCADAPIFTSVAHFGIFSAPFLLIPDNKFLGYKPFRTYIGPRYQGGISDHLPVVLRIERNY